MRGWAWAALVLLVAAAAAGCLGAGEDGAPTPASAGNDSGEAGGFTPNGTEAEADEEPNGTEASSEEPDGSGADGNRTAEERSPLPGTLGGYEVANRVEVKGTPSFMHVDEARDVLLVGRGDDGLATFDVSDPANPVLLGEVLETGEGDPLYARSMDLVERNGSTYAVVAGNRQGIHVVDLDDPAEPRLVATASQWPSHHLAAVPGTPYVYDAHEVEHFLVPADGEYGPTDKAQGPVIPVLDLTDPADPSWTTFPIPATVAGTPATSDGCHRISVRADLGQAYCAGGGETYGYGGGETFVWNITGDPADPEWVGIADHPAMAYHHQAMASADGSLLLVGDESLGPNCQRAADGQVDGPVAALWVFDLSDPSNPEALGHVQADRPPQAGDDFGQATFCSAHLGDLVADRDAAAWSWWGAGTTLVDFSDPQDPTIVDRVDDDGIVTDARYHDGHVYTGASDLVVLRIVGPGGG